MRHRKAHAKLNMTASHRKAVFKNLANALFEHERIKTTNPKAMELRRVADRLISLAKKNDMHAMRLAFAFLRNKEMVKKLFSDIGARYAEINGGYTRVLKAGYRKGDAAPMAIIELTQRKETESEKKARRRPRQRRPRKQSRRKPRQKRRRPRNPKRRRKARPRQRRPRPKGPRPKRARQEISRKQPNRGKEGEGSRARRTTTIARIPAGIVQRSLFFSSMNKRIAVIIPVHDSNPWTRLSITTEDRCSPCSDRRSSHP